MLSGIAQTALAITLLAPLMAASLAALLGARWPGQLLRLSAAVACIGFLAAVGLAARLTWGAETVVGQGVLRLNVDPVAAIMLLLIFGVSAVAQTYAVRYLAGDSRRGWFAAGASLLTTSSAVMVTAVTPVGIGIGWTAAGIALCMLLATYWHLPAARDGVRRTAVAFLIGDIALWSAIGLVTLDDSADGIVPTVAAVLVVTAALSRSAQLPFHQWLPATLAAPTPVSALLHAGAVNAGALLLLRLHPVYDVAVASALAITAGAATMLYGAAVMLVKPDVKGALAHSTMAQMGFMILTCGLGLWAAAVIHLVAHGFYKATLFLSSGSAIAARRRNAPIPRAVNGRQRAAAALLAVALPTGALLTALAVIPASPAHHTAEYALLIFAWVTGAAATWGWLRRRPGVSGAGIAAIFLVPAAVAYLGLIRAVGHVLAPALPASAGPDTTTWAVVAASVTLLAAIATVRYSPTSVHSAIYTRILAAGHVPTPTTGAHR